MQQGTTQQQAMLNRAAILAGDEAGFASFFTAAVQATDSEDLGRQDPGAFEATLRRSYQSVLSYQGEASQIIVTPPARSGDALVLDVISPDMPFIVDSVLAALRTTGGMVRLFAHPVVWVDQGQVTEGKGCKLSVLHIHSDPVADVDAVVEEITATMAEVARAVGDWQPMLERLRAAAGVLATPRSPQRDEAVAFLDWLSERNFTFLGVKEYRVGAEGLQPVAGSGLGVLRDESFKVLRTGSTWVESTPQHEAFMAGNEPLLVTKANVRARVHRRVHMDYVGIKLFGADGTANGELRVLGLFTAQAQATPHSEVPLIRRKIAEVMRKSGLDPLGHDARALLSALDSYPRDEMFQIGVAQLHEFASAIAALYDRPRVRVLPRIDRFDNFVSILVYVPRDRYDGEARARITRYLAQVYDGRVSAYYPHFPEGELVRLHVIIGRVAGTTPQPVPR